MKQKQMSEKAGYVELSHHAKPQKYVGLPKDIVDYEREVARRPPVVNQITKPVIAAVLTSEDLKFIVQYAYDLTQSINKHKKLARREGLPVEARFERGGLSEKKFVLLAIFRKIISQNQKVE